MEYQLIKQAVTESLKASEYELVKNAVSEAIKAEMKDFYVDREKHYQHHEFIDDLMKWSICWKSTFGKAIANAIAVAIIGLIVWGFVAWGNKNFH